MRHLMKALFFLTVLALLPVHRSAHAQAVRSPAEVLGYELGERFTTVAAIHHYLNGLAEASDLVSVHPYGESYEGRPLIQVLVASPAHRARLEEILDLNRELTDPETSQERAREIIRTNPAVVYISYGVHGNEASSPEAAIWTAYDLARGAEDVGWALDSVLVVIDPAVNPDGRARYVTQFRQLRGMEPNPNGATGEHRASGGRTNHYGFDLNRDWAWASQVETQLRLATWDRWKELDDRLREAERDWDDE
ncbi:M14 family zinc carboxypeptidase, partial [Gemmatimonadota bacterium]